VRRGPFVAIEQNRVFTMKTYVAAAVGRQRRVKLFKRREEQIADAVPHVDFVGDGE
jgi:hypothetical protein